MYLKENKKGIVVSIILHALLLLLFLFFGMNYSVPPPEEEGITIKFGTSTSGMNKLQADDSPQQKVPVEQQSEPSPTKSNDPQKLTTQNTTATVKVEEKGGGEPKEKTASERLKEALEAANKSNENNGITDEPGNQGDKNGDKNSTHYKGSGTGNGISFSLNGRGLVSFKKPKNPTQEEGVVVVTIWVDQTGRVFKAEPGARGSTTTNSVLYQIAKEASLQAKFSTKEVSVTQKGTMTFIFLLE